MLLGSVRSNNKHLPKMNKPTLSFDFDFFFFKNFYFILLFFFDLICFSRSPLWRDAAPLCRQNLFPCSFCSFFPFPLSLPSFPFSSLISNGVRLDLVRHWIFARWCVCFSSSSTYTTFQRNVLTRRKIRRRVHPPPLAWTHGMYDF